MDISAVQSAINNVEIGLKKYIEIMNKLHNVDVSDNKSLIAITDPVVELIRDGLTNLDISFDRALYDYDRKVFVDADNDLSRNA